MSLQIRPAGPGDRNAVCALLHEKMNRRVPLERWRWLIDGRWAPWTDEFGVVAVDGDRLAGFLGVVYAERRLPNGPQRSGNLTSWYIGKTYRGRGLGLDMLLAATSRNDITYTTFSSNPPALRLMKKAGLELLDDKRLIWDAGRKVVPSGVEILTEPHEIRRHLSACAAQLMADHAGLNVRPYLIRPDGGNGCLVLLYVKEKGADIAYHEILHVGEPAVFGRHAAAFAAEILPPRQALLSVDSRFLPGDIKPDRVEPIEVPRFYRPVGMRAAEVDFLYSEIVLLDLKLY